MFSYIKHELKTFAAYFYSFYKWLVIASVIGAVCGLVGAAFHALIGLVTSFRGTHPAVIWFLPLGGLLIVGLYQLSGMQGKGTPTVIDAVLNDGHKVPSALAPVIFAATTLTHFLGGSAGREGAALQIGGSIGSNIGRNVFNLNNADKRVTILCGMAAVFTALFGTPVGAALFVLELSNVGALCYSALVPCVISSATAYIVTRSLGIEPTRFAVEMPHLTVGLMGRAVILAILCAIFSVLICRTFILSERWMEKGIKNPYLRVAVGGAALIGLTLLFGTDYNGAGEPVFRRAIELGECAPEAFILKLLFTALTLSAGFRGGEVVPTFFMGATFGCLVGPWLGLPAGFAAAVGLAATFCGATNCPLATLLLSAELFGGGRLDVFAAACAVSYLFSGYASLYPNQLFLYSKVEAELWRAGEHPEDELD